MIVVEGNCCYWRALLQTIVVAVHLPVPWVDLWASWWSRYIAVVAEVHARSTTMSCLGKRAMVWMFMLGIILRAGATATRWLLIVPSGFNLRA
jgi:hypothetical protein